MLWIAICDDDESFLEQFEQLLAVNFAAKGKAVTIHKYDNGHTLVSRIEKEKQLYHMIFLDVEMPEANGFQVAARLKELNTSAILLFTTYIEHQSREGYRYGAFRYIFKNHLETEVEEAVNSILNRLDNCADNRETIALKYRNSGVLENLTIRKGDILFLKREKDRRVHLKTVVSEYELLMKTLSTYIGMLASPNFQTITRNYIVNFNHVQKFDTDDFILTGGVRVPLGIKREVKKASRDKYLLFLQEQL